MRRSLSVPAEQPSLFEVEPIAIVKKRFHKARSVEPVEKTWPEYYGEPGSRVDVKERALLLTSALRAFGARNSRMFFPLAANTSPQDKEIEDHYGDDLPRVLQGAERNKVDYLKRARRDFWQATGLAAIKWTGLIRPEQVEPLKEIWWDDFVFFYMNRRRADDRTSYIEALETYTREPEGSSDATEAAA